jgi:hypothetical protein
MKKAAAVLLVMALLAGVANAAVAVVPDSVLGVNFSSAWAGPHVGMGAHGTDQTADGFSNWTDSDPISSGDGSASGTGLVLLGSNSGVTVDWASSNVWYAGLEDNAENALYRCYLDDGGNGALITIHGLNSWLTSVGATGYKVRIYQNTDWTKDNGDGTRSPSPFLPTNITDGTTILEIVQPTNNWLGSNSWGGIDGTRAFVDSGTLTVDTLVIDGASGPDWGLGARGGIAAVKITAVPEPATMILLGLGGLLLRRKK